MANDINKEDPHYKGEYGSIYEVNRKFPTGGVAGDFVVIDGWAHYWNADRGTWCVNAERDSYWDELITNIIEKFKLVRGATYMGVASLNTEPAKAIGAKMYYFATVAGKYKNFDNLVVPQGINVLYSENGSSWVNTTLLEVAQELGVSTNKVVSQKILNDALAKKFDKESVVQESGGAEDKVMSQKAVSDKLSDLAFVKTDFEDLTFVNAFIRYSDGTLSGASGSSWKTSEIIPVFVGDTISYNIDGTLESSAVIAAYDSKGNYLQDKSLQGSPTEITGIYTVEEGVANVRICLYQVYSGYIKRDKWHQENINEVKFQAAIDELQTSKFDKTSIVQESGKAEDKVMSQKAVSDKLSDLNIIRNETIKNLSKCEYGCPTSLYDSLQYIGKDDIFVQLVSNKQYPRKITKLTYKGIDAGTLKIYKVKIVDDIAQAPILIKVVSGQTASIKETELDVLLSKDEYIGVSGGFSYSNNADSEYSTMLVSSTGGEVSKTRSQYLGYTLYGESYSSRIDEIENATEENHLKTEQNTKDISALSKKVDEISSDKLYERKDFVDGMYYAAESRYRTDGNYGKVIHTPNMEIQGVILTIPKDKVGSYGFSVNFWDSNGGYIGNWFTNHTFTELQHNGFTKDNSVLFSKDDINTAISQKKYNNVQYYTIEVFDFTDTYYDIPQDADIVVSKYNSRQNLISENIIVVDEFGGGDYTSLQEAIDTRKDIGARGKPLVIFLMPGTYRMSQTTSENRGYCSYRTISIIGANKDSCIIRNDDGVYNTGASGTYIDSAPLKMAGNCYLENLTIISTATNSTSEASENKSYCVHLDFFANEGSRLTVHNCRMINDHNCCIGIGLHKGYTIEISYCELESTNTNGNGWGTIIAHEGSEKGDCKLILKDNVIVDHTNNGITIDHPYNGNIVLDLVRNVVVNNGSPITMDNKYHTLSNMCFGNNRNEMNKQT